MFSINLQRPLVTLAVIAGLLAVAGPASASSGVVAADFNYSERATGSTAPRNAQEAVASRSARAVSQTAEGNRSA